MAIAQRCVTHVTRPMSVTAVLVTKSGARISGEDVAQWGLTSWLPNGEGDEDVAGDEPERCSLPHPGLHGEDCLDISGHGLRGGAHAGPSGGGPGRIDRPGECDPAGTD